MRIRLKSIAAILLGFVLAVTMSAAVLTAFAGEDTGLSETEVTDALKEKLKDKNTTDDFVIASWVSFYDTKYASTYDQLADLKKTGHTLIMHPEVCTDIRTTDGPIAADHEFWKTFDEYAQEYGLMYYFKYRQQDVGEGDADFEFVRNELSDQCVGYYIGDEPPATQVPVFGERTKDILSKDDDRFVYANLYPSYAGSVNLGGTYEDYIRNYVEACGGSENFEYLSIDHYPFRDGSDSATYFSDIETVRKVAYENNKMKTWAMPQTCTWGAMRTTTRGEERWNVYSYLAYGVKALSSFCWVCPGNSDTEGEGFYEGVIYRDGTIRDQEKYDFLSDLNWETRSLGTVLMNLDTVHAYHTQDNAQGVEVLPGNYIVKPANSSTDFIVSYMEGKEGTDTNDHIMLFNKSYTESKTVSFEISEFSGIEGIEYYNPYTMEYEPVDISSGMLTDTFKEGEGKLYRLIGDVNTDMSVEAPEMSTEGGIYTAGLNTSLSCSTADAQIYYTLDGSFPTAESRLYSGENILLGSEGAGAYVLRAIAYKNGSYSSIAEQRYFILSDSAETEQIDTAKWTTTGGGTWSYADGVYRQAAGSSNWNCSYTYTGKKYSDFLIEADITAQSLASGFVGFGLRKTRIDATQDNFMEGFYVAFDSDNNVFVYEGSGGQQKVKESMPSGSSAAKTVRLAVLCSEQNIYVYVDGQRVFEYRNNAFDLGEGYISLHSGTMPVTFENLRIIDLSEGEYALPEKQEAITGAEYDAEVSVDKYTLYSQVLEQLPETIAVTDTNGDVTEMGVAWSCPDYDKNTTGSYFFTGEIRLPDGDKFLNLYGVKPKLTVSVGYVNDYSEINRLIAQVESLNEEDFTPESWERMYGYYLAAKEIVADKTMAQNAVKVGAWQLEDQIEALERIGIFKTVFDAELARAKEIAADGYTAKSFAALQAAIAYAEGVGATGVSTQEEIDVASVMLSDARKALAAVADLTELQGAVAEAESVSTEGKTEQSVQKLQAAIASAKALAERGDVSQAEADAAVRMLENAAASLTAESDLVHPTSDGSGQQGGCGGVAAGTSAASLLAAACAAAGVAVQKRRNGKNDRPKQK